MPSRIAGELAAPPTSSASVCAGQPGSSLSGVRVQGVHVPLGVAEDDVELAGALQIGQHRLGVLALPEIHGEAAAQTRV